MKVKIKILGKVQRFNGINIDQTKYYIKLSCHTYYKKIFVQYNWINKEQNKTKPVPFTADPTYSKILEEAMPPTTETETEQEKLRNKWDMHF